MNMKQLNPYNLAGKTALVTGSSRGIGRATALKLARLGAKVIFHGVRESEKLLSAVAEAGGEAEFLTADFGNMDEVASFADLFDVTYDPAMIKTAVEDMVTFLDGGEVEKDHVIPVSVVDASNVDQFQGFGDAVAAE